MLDGLYLADPRQLGCDVDNGSRTVRIARTSIRWVTHSDTAEETRR